MYTAAIVTVSDKGFAGEREDKSGAFLHEALTNYGYQVSLYEIVPDERQLIADLLAKIADENIAQLVVTTGGTGFSPRDCTPEATLDVVEKQCPGIPEAMRSMSIAITKRAMLTRSMAGIRKGTLIINLPGSVRAVAECLDCIADQLGHGLDVLTGASGDCGTHKR